jgi:NAD(P)H-flavin reductase
MEVHAFATIPEPNGEKGFSSIVSSAGDWTKRVVANPPDKLWVRDIYSWGLLHISTMFSKIVIVTTGSGIGPCLSLFNSQYNVPCRILWSTRNPELTYGRKILDAVLKTDPNALIIDTGEKGRHDMIQLSYDLYRESQAEAVMVISNPALTYKVVFGLESRGIPAYGPIWDS